MCSLFEIGTITDMLLISDMTIDIRAVIIIGTWYKLSLK